MHLDQFILRAEKRVLRAEHGQYVHGSCRHLRLRELEGAPRGRDRILLTLLLFGGIYILIFSAGVLYIYRLLRQGPLPTPIHPERVNPKRPLAVGGPDSHRGIGFDSTPS